MLLVVVAEYSAPELLHLSDDVPRTVVADGLHNILQQPLQHDIGMRQRVDEPVDGLFLHLDIIETNAQVGSQVELPSQVPQHTLEECVDGLHTEIVVVVQ